VRPPTVGHDFLFGVEFLQLVLKFGEGNIDSARDVACGVFFRRPNIQHRDQALSHALEEFLAGGEVPADLLPSN
jgi:hypothetical protein